ncbi:MAG: DCC1-like thiol-disulfide oxidoreductase family protein [Gemmatimonadota bacterium]|uniref:thiol-disulfide oxidoreductase DCC family protein n=1 Tax=Candidatus Palauibacter scopulicola TaxID=3056741 RepID=UPI0023995F4D|nr:DCC1-like thiol-disulfide oxidoreductase family protein [Candidatus Palauibacter scopulicola]MDE2661472.1 DCC1-like thiol-disulfide oxidoreductase family protein [Candidatus Palauibacter scopulicola]
MNQAAGTGDRGPRTDDPGPEGPIVLFDGVCNLCAGAVRFIIRRDRRGRFRFAALQSDVGRRFLAGNGVETPGPGEPPPEAAEPPESLVLVANGRTYARSGAALRIAAGLDRAWPLAAVLLVIPAPLRDLVYRFVARNRYRWFGKQTACELPRTDESWRFLDA